MVDRGAIPMESARIMDSGTKGNNFIALNGFEDIQVDG